MESILASLTSGPGSSSDQHLEHSGPNEESGTVVGGDDDDDDIEDVMEVLTDLTGNAFTEGGKSAGKEDVVDGLTSVQDVSKVVDKSSIMTEEDPAALAERKLLRLTSRQATLEKRWESLGKRMNHLRCRKFGTHIVQELQYLTSSYERYVPPDLSPPQGLSQFVPPPPSANVLPFLPRTPIPPLPTTPLTPASLALTQTSAEPKENGKLKKPKTKKSKLKNPVDDEPNEKIALSLGPSDEKKQQLNDALGRLSANFRHLLRSYDSEATESSSGGDSCDEMESFDLDATKTVPIKQRARYTYLTNRAGVASRWTWLTAQIADLECRIRQQTELYRQIRNVKGPLVLGRQEVVEDAKADHENLVRTEQHSVFNMTDESGRKIVLKGPLDPPYRKDPDDPPSACRTRPVKSFRRRSLFSTQGLYRSSAKAAKESSVLCGCIHPLFSCAICFGRSNHMRPPDPVFQSKAKTAALLDHSYHQVLSRYNKDVPVDIALAQKLKGRSWMVDSSDDDGTKDKGKGAFQQDCLGEEAKKAGKLVPSKKRKRRKKREMDDDAVDDLLDEEFGSAKKACRRRNSDGSAICVSKKKARRRKSVTVHHHSDGNSVAMMDINGIYDHDSGSMDAPSSFSSQAFTMEQIRRRRETAFDIDDIVIPYSTMATARVERLQYKEIQTPYWRVVDDGDGANDDEKDGLEAKMDKSIPASQCELKDEIKEEPEDAEGEDVPKDVGESSTVSSGVVKVEAAAETTSKESAEDAVEGGSSHWEEDNEQDYVLRHAKAELEEQARWKMPQRGNRGNRRQDSRLSAEVSSGCNTPDPLSPGVVETLEVETRPSTPTNEEGLIPPAAGSIRNRRRTSSATKSRDRNPSEDCSSSRCTTPVYFHREVRPYESRQFPLSDAGYEAILQNVPPQNESVATVYAGDNQSSPPPPPAKPNAAAKPASGTSSRRVSLTSSPHVVISRLRMSRDSSMDEEDEEMEEIDSMDEDDIDCEDFLDEEEEEEEEEDEDEWLDDGGDDDPDDPEWDVVEDRLGSSHEHKGSSSSKTSKKASKGSGQK